MNDENEAFISDIRRVVRLRYTLRMLDGTISGCLVTLVILYGVIRTILGPVLCLLPEDFIPWAVVTIEATLMVSAYRWVRRSL
jgi:hypothetical protein